MVEKTCQECGKIIEPKEYTSWKTRKTIRRVYPSRKYCSDECREKALIKERVGHYRRQKMAIWISKDMKEKIDVEKNAMNYYRSKSNERVSEDDVIRRLFEVTKEAHRLRDWLHMNYPNILEGFQKGKKVSS